jgi:type VI secretion system secreted protein Hcp
MGVNIVLKIADVPGESAVKGHVGEIDCLSWSWGMTQSASAHIATGAGTGSADVRDLTITKYVDSASPNLFARCFDGHNVGKTILTCIKVGGKGGPIDYVKITMDKNVIVSSVSSGDMEMRDGKPTDRFIETVTFNFAKVNFEYTGQKDDQSKGATLSSNDLDIAARA